MCVVIGVAGAGGLDIVPLVAGGFVACMPFHLTL
jgi:hypothetical protein